MGKTARTLLSATAAFVLAIPLSIHSASASASASSVWTQSRLPAISAPTGSISGVSCPTTTDCEAVGYFGGVAKDLVVAELWNGTSWTVQPMVKPADARVVQMSGVACVSADACTAVGYDTTGSSSDAVAESWDGTNWQLETTSRISDAGLESVSCTAADSCEAVGDYISGSDAGPVAGVWNGTSWSLETMPGVSGGMDTSVASVSCSSGDSCEAVGEYTKTVGDQEFGLAWVWGGTSWSVQTLPPQGGASDYPFLLNGVSCGGGGDCWAVGGYSPSSTSPAPLAMSYGSGSWTNVTIPDSDAELSAVSCFGSVCEAVGNSYPATDEVPVAVQLDGTDGSAQAIPDPPARLPPASWRSRGRR